MIASEELETRSAAETEAVAARLAASLPAPAVVLLLGDLGAGKTTFVRGLAAGCGVDPGEVTSPTFTLIQSYRGRRTLHHVDLYRLSREETEELGLEELASEPGAIVAIEWAERLEIDFQAAVEVAIEDLGDDLRLLRIRPR